MTKSDRPWKRKLRTRALCDRYDVVSRTIDRWVQIGILPPPMIINNVRYWDEDEIDRRDQERMAEANREAPAAHAGAYPAAAKSATTLPGTSSPIRK